MACFPVSYYSILRDFEQNYYSGQFISTGSQCTFCNSFKLLKFFLTHSMICLIRNLIDRGKNMLAFSFDVVTKSHSVISEGKDV